MLQFIRRHSLSKDYIHFAGALFAIMFGMVMWIGISAYNSQATERSKLLESEAQKVDQALSESFNTITYLMLFIQNQISLNGNDLNYINTLYKGLKNDERLQDLPSSSMFDWITPDKIDRISSTHGILEPPVDLSMRENLSEALARPGHVAFNAPDIGKISKQLIIPAALAVTGKDKKTVGIVGIGITVEGITSKIEHNLTNNHLRFALLTKNLDFVTESSTNSPKLDKDFLKKNLQENHFLDEKKRGRKVTITLCKCNL